MAKSFNTNVATAWITKDIVHSEEVQADSAVSKKVESDETEKKSDEMDKKTGQKKESSYISKEPKKAKQESSGFTIVGKEKKTRTTSFLLTESNYTKLSALAKKNGISVNSCLNQILEQIL
ncbi:MAG: hypothetical protein MJ188_02960 [Treponema sp.]|nr:hypothetical protein [Treponema sp.]